MVKMKRLTGSAKEISQILDAEYAAYAKSQDFFQRIRCLEKYT